MIYLVSYIEEVKIGWRAYDRWMFDILDTGFGIDIHYYIPIDLQKDGDWFWSKGRGGEDKRFVADLPMLKRVLGDINYVNVQPAKVLRSLGKVGQNLTNFIHPDEDVCYIFGPNKGKIELLPGYNVYITLEKSALHASSAAAIVLYDRRAKIETGTRGWPTEKRD